MGVIDSSQASRTPKFGARARLFSQKSWAAERWVSFHRWSDEATAVQPSRNHDQPKLEWTSLKSHRPARTVRTAWGKHMAKRQESIKLPVSVEDFLKTWATNESFRNLLQRPHKSIVNVSTKKKKVPFFLVNVLPALRRFSRSIQFAIHMESAGKRRRHSVRCAMESGTVDEGSLSVLGGSKMLELEGVIKLLRMYDQCTGPEIICCVCGKRTCLLCQRKKKRYPLKVSLSESCRLTMNLFVCSFLAGR